MKLMALRCPNCGSRINGVDGLDTFYCKYCGYQIMMEDMSGAAYAAKTRVRELESEEDLYDMSLAQERFKMKFQREEERHAMKWLMILLLACMSLLFFFAWQEKKEKQERQEELQGLVEDVMEYIDEGNFKKAYATAEQIKWDGGMFNSETRKWNKTRRRLIKEIEKAEKAAKKK